MRRYDYITNQTSNYCTDCNGLTHNFKHENIDTSSSEEEMDFIERIIPVIKEEEMKNLIMYIPPPLTDINPILKMFTSTTITGKLNSLLNPNKFFVDKINKKIPFLMSLPNSYLPIIKKPTNSKDLICAPTYMDEAEEQEYTRPFYIDKKVYKVEKNGRGMEFRYNLETQPNDQSSYVFYQRQLYEKILKDRLVNGNPTKNKDNNEGESDEEVQEFNLPMTVYEPVSFLKRFCDMFYYLDITFNEIMKREDEELILKKFMSGLIAGFHRSLASQGVPFGPLIGETYEVENSQGDFKLFAEVKNDKPVNITYNIRWRKRTILIDGFTEFTHNFSESRDEFVLTLKGFNRMKILKKDNKYKIFDFSLPESVTFRNIIDDDEKARSMTVDGFMYIRGDLLSSITAFNYYKSTEMFKAFYGLINRKFTNIDYLLNGHSFIGLIFHNSGLSLSEIDNGEIFEDFFTGKREDINEFNLFTAGEENSNLLNKPEDNGRFIGIPFEGEIIPPKYETDNKLIDNNSKATKNQKVFTKKQRERSEKIKKIHDERIKKDKLAKNKNPRINKNKWRKVMKVFVKVCQFMSRITKDSTFITCFASSFIFKIMLGSYAYLNFFEINHNVTTPHSLIAFFLRFDNTDIKSRPFSDYNPKEGIKIIFDKYKFFKNPSKIYREDLWKPVRNPLNTDTRFREDMLWLLRFHQLMSIDITPQEGTDFEKKPVDFEAKDELDRKRLEAFINAGRWRDVLEAYTTVNISYKLNSLK